MKKQNAGAKPTPPKKTAKPSEAEQVSDYMHQLQHPLKTEINAVRDIIKNARAGISERIKWNAPSYYYKGVDLVTFHVREMKKVHLVFHNIAIVQVQSDLLEGDYKDRRMVYFQGIEDVEAHKNELERIMIAYTRLIENV